MKTPNQGPLTNKTSLRNQSWVAAFIILALTLLVYSPVCGFQFSSIDDGPNVYQNPYLEYARA